MASVKRIGKSSFWIATFRDMNARSLTRTTKVEIGGSPKERAENRKRALEIANGFEELSRGGSPAELKIRKTAFELAAKANSSHVGEISVQKFFEDYLSDKERSVKPGSMERYRNAVEKFLEAIGSDALFPIERLKAKDVERFIDFRHKSGVSRGTIHNDLKNLNPAFVRAIRDGILAFNPIAAVDFKDEIGTPHQPFKPEEIYTILDHLRQTDLKLAKDRRDWRALQQDWGIAIALGYYTGMRLGDCCNRKWSDFDFSSKKLIYVPQKTEKSLKGKPIVIPVHSELIEVLLSHRKGDGLFVTPLLRDREQHRDRSWLSKHFLKIMVAAGVDPMTLRNPSTHRVYNQRSFHSLRATCNSNMANAGISQEIRMRIVGHAAKEVNDMYTHFDASVVTGAVESIPKIAKG